jgi:hypothetical protein
MIIDRAIWIAASLLIGHLGIVGADDEAFYRADEARFNGEPDMEETWKSVRKAIRELRKRRKTGQPLQ